MVKPAAGWKPSSVPAPVDPADIVLDLAGRLVKPSRAEATWLRDAAAAEAGDSLRSRDLSLLLDRALTTRQTLALRRAEARTLALIARRAGLEGLASQLADGPG